LDFGGYGNPELKKDLKISPMKNSLEFSPSQVSDQSKIHHRRHKLPFMSKRYRNNTASLQLMPNCTNTMVPIEWLIILLHLEGQSSSF